MAPTSAASGTGSRPDMASQAANNIASNICPISIDSWIRAIMGES
jgi:hypothetical protein